MRRPQEVHALRRKVQVRRHVIFSKLNATNPAVPGSLQPSNLCLRTGEEYTRNLHASNAVIVTQVFHHLQT